MTRINIVPPELLINKHLMAEYRELPRVFTRVKWRINKGQKLDDIQHKISCTYVLNTGHETFFNDKLYWLYKRYINIVQELIKRGYNLSRDVYTSVIEDAHTNFYNTVWWGDYSPTPEECYINMARLCKRSNLVSVAQEL